MHQEDTSDNTSPADFSETRHGSVHDRIRGVLEFLEQNAYEDALGMLRDLHPADQAEVLLVAPETVRDGIAPLLGATQWAAILEHIDGFQAAHLLQELDPIALASVLDEVRPEIATDLLRQLPDDKANIALSESNRAGEIEILMAYSDQTAGGLMSPVTVTVSGATTASQAMGLLRNIAPLPQEQSNFFVLDTEGVLVGTVSLHALVFSEPSNRVYNIMTETTVSVSPHVDQEECVRLMERYDLADLPVVDLNGKLLGTILFQEVFDVAQEEATEDMYRLAGLGVRETVASSLGRSVLQRLPWLLLNLGTVVMAAAIIFSFKSTILKLVALAAFMPVVAGQGGVAGTQTLTLMVRSIALGEVSFRGSRSLVGREILLGTVNGVLLGLIVGIVGFIWEDSPVLGIALFIAMVANMVVAALAGAVTPLGLRAMGFDPALASVVVVTTVTDIAGFAIFLGTATLLLQYI